MDIYKYFSHWKLFSTTCNAYFWPLSNDHNAICHRRMKQRRLFNFTVVHFLIWVHLFWHVSFIQFNDTNECRTFCEEERERKKQTKKSRLSYCHHHRMTFFSIFNQKLTFFVIKWPTNGEKRYTRDEKNSKNPTRKRKSIDRKSKWTFHFCCCLSKKERHQSDDDIVCRQMDSFVSIGWFFFSASSQAIAGVFAMHAKRTSNETMNDSRLGGHWYMKWNLIHELRSSSTERPNLNIKRQVGTQKKRRSMQRDKKSSFSILEKFLLWFFFLLCFAQTRAHINYSVFPKFNKSERNNWRRKWFSFISMLRNKHLMQNDWHGKAFDWWRNQQRTENNRGKIDNEGQRESKTYMANCVIVKKNRKRKRRLNKSNDFTVTIALQKSPE